MAATWSDLPELLRSFKPLIHFRTAQLDGPLVASLQPLAEQAASSQPRLVLFVKNRVWDCLGLPSRPETVRQDFARLAEAITQGTVCWGVYWRWVRACPCMCSCFQAASSSVPACAELQNAHSCLRIVQLSGVHS